MRAAYKIVTGTSDRVDRSVENVSHPLARENIVTTNLPWVEVSSRRKNAIHNTLCRTIVHAKSGASILMEIEKDRDGNLPVSKLRPSEIMGQSFAPRCCLRRSCGWSFKAYDCSLSP